MAQRALLDEDMHVHVHAHACTYLCKDEDLMAQRALLDEDITRRDQQRLEHVHERVTERGVVDQQEDRVLRVEGAIP